MWEEIVKLCKRAALAFLPSKCLARDIAITSAGPALIEADRYWDPHCDMELVLRQLRAEFAKIHSRTVDSVKRAPEPGVSTLHI
jgi:hypothetical protein